MIPVCGLLGPTGVRHSTKIRGRASASDGGQVCRRTAAMKKLSKKSVEAPCRRVMLNAYGQPQPFQCTEKTGDSTMDPDELATLEL
eukprot:2592434-Prymnesium_polylepis.1